VQHVHAVTITDGNFGAEVEQAPGLVVVDFGADWCGPCLMMAPVVERFAADHRGRVKVGTLDVDANPATAARFGVRSIPTMLVFRDGALVDRLVGAMPGSVLEQKVAAHLRGATAGPPLVA
jgi:thioredoxin